jgi:23S rRNA U2552 (ribose-2'-O)-methylase RlmE/FtsJ
MNLQLEERRVLLESEKEKAVGVLVREKDVLSRANFKLLQLI